MVTTQWGQGAKPREQDQQSIFKIRLKMELRPGWFGGFGFPASWIPAASVQLQTGIHLSPGTEANELQAGSIFYSPPRSKSGPLGSFFVP